MLVTGHAIFLMLRVEPTDNRYGGVCHARGLSVGSACVPALDLAFFSSLVTPLATAFAVCHGGLAVGLGIGPSVHRPTA